VAAMPDHLLAYEAARYARKNDIPFLVDIRDLWPDIFLDRFRSMGLYGVEKIAFALDFARLVFLLKNADSLIAVSQGYLKWGLDKIGRPESSFDKVFYHGYKKGDLENPADADGSLDFPVWLRGREKQKIFLFIGTFGVSYKLEFILDAVERFEKSGRSDICLVLAGCRQIQWPGFLHRSRWRDGCLRWEKIAGNQFAYCNRLRTSDYLALFRESGFNVCRKDGNGNG